MDFPRLAKVQQCYPSLKIPDAAEETKRALAKSNLRTKIKPGMKVGITAGSRGIKNIVEIFDAVITYIKALGGVPVIIPAMGSHGGGSPAGQEKILSSLGITAENLGAPIAYSTEYIEIGRVFYGALYAGDKAFECDAVILLNRIKPHTSFHGEYESGLLKMLVVGLGGAAGAASFHSCHPSLLSRALKEAGGFLLKKLPVVLGLAVLEDAHEDTMEIHAIEPEEILDKEKYLLHKARSFLPSLPAERLDILIVDEIGKNYSGTGMDTNVIGRLRIQGLPEPACPAIERIIVLDISSKTHGNAYGIGLADFTTERLVEKINRQATFTNALASTFTQRAMIPMHFKNDFEVLRAALKTLNVTDPSIVRLIRIRNTLNLSEMLVSEALITEVVQKPHIKQVGALSEIHFDENGNMLPF